MKATWIASGCSWCERCAEIQMIEWRTADGQLERLPQLADDLLRLDVAVIVATTDYGAKAAQ